MKEIKAIETRYGGYNFRSRTEARWAVFFKTMGIQFTYEPEGLILPDGTWYLPDFYLPESDTWFEAKGVLDDTSIKKIGALLKYGNRPVVVGYSDMTFEACDLWEDEGGMKIFTPAEKKESVLIKCRRCGKLFFTGWQGSWRCLCCEIHEGDHHISPMINGDLSECCKGAEYAVSKAKQERFEEDN